MTKKSKSIRVALAMSPLLVAMLGIAPGMAAAEAAQPLAISTAFTAADHKIDLSEVDFARAALLSGTAADDLEAMVAEKCALYDNEGGHVKCSFYSNFNSTADFADLNVDKFNV